MKRILIFTLLIFSTALIAQTDRVIKHLGLDQDLKFIVNDGGTDKEAMVIQGSTGNVGVGTLDPGRPLEVLNVTDAGAGQIRLSTGATSYWEMGRDPANGKFILKEGTNDPAFVIDDANGNVGIGTDSPSENLHVAADNPKIFIQDTAGGSQDDFSFELGSSLFKIRNETDNRDDITLDGSGNVSIAGRFESKNTKIFSGDTNTSAINILTVATDNGSGVVFLKILHTRNNTSLQGGEYHNALTQWHGSTKGSVTFNTEMTVDVNINPPTVAWSGNTLQVTFDSTSTGGVFIIEAYAEERSGTPFTWQ